MNQYTQFGHGLEFARLKMFNWKEQQIWISS